MRRRVRKAHQDLPARSALLCVPLAFPSYLPQMVRTTAVDSHRKRGLETLLSEAPDSADEDPPDVEAKIDLEAALRQLTDAPVQRRFAASDVVVRGTCTTPSAAVFTLGAIGVHDPGIGVQIRPVHTFRMFGAQYLLSSSARCASVSAASYCPYSTSSQTRAFICWKSPRGDSK